MTCARFAALATGMLFVLLAGAVRGEDAKTPRTDLYGDPLPPGVMARLGTVRLRHGGASVAFSRDGKHLISCDKNGTIRFWDTATGKQRRQNQLPWERARKGFEGIEGMIAVGLSPDGATVAGWDRHTISVCDTDTGKERGRIPSISPIRQDVFVFTFSPDSKLLAVQTPGERQEILTQIWDATTVEKRRTLKNPPDVSLTSVAFTWEGKRLAGIARKSDDSGKLGLFGLFLWDAASGKLLGKREDLRQLDDDSFAFSPDSKTLAVGGHYEQVVRLFDAATLKDKTRQKMKLEYPGTLNGLVYSPNGRWLAAVYGTDANRGPAEQGIVIWDRTGARKTRQIPARYGTEIAFAPDGKTLACHDSEGSGIRLYDAATGQPQHQRPGHDRPVVALAASPDRKLLASGDADGVARLWDAATSKQLRVLMGQPLDITICLFSPDGKRLVAAGTSHNTAFQVFEEHVAFQVWDVATGKALRRIEMKEGEALYAATISADGKRLAAIVSGEDASALRWIVWDLATGKRLSQRPYKFEVRIPAEGERNNPAETIVHASFAPDGARMTVWLGDRVGLVEVARGCLLAELPRNVGAPLVFSPNGRLLAAALWKPRKGLRVVDDLMGLSLIETASGQEILRLELGESLPESGVFDRIAFSADGRRILVMDGKHLTVWDTDTGTKLHQREQPEGMAVSYSRSGQVFASPLVALPDGRVATGMKDGTVLLWDVAAATGPIPKPAGERDNRNLDALWSDLAGNARTAHRVVGTLTAAPAQTVPFLKDRLHPTAVDGKRIDKLLTHLDGDSFAAREAAVRELTRLHYRAEPMLRRALQNKPSLEIRRRLQDILTGPKRPLPDDLRTLRAIAVLEHIGTPEARCILQELSTGAAAPETHEAKAALQRLDRRFPLASGRSSP
jgi:WD40 repeat protein